jgi:hypothetical protein
VAQVVTSYTNGNINKPRTPALTCPYCVCSAMLLVRHILPAEAMRTPTRLLPVLQPIPCLLVARSGACSRPMLWARSPSPTGSSCCVSSPLCLTCSSTTSYPAPSRWGSNYLLTLVPVLRKTPSLLNMIMFSRYHPLWSLRINAWHVPAL